ncbi:acid protease [Stipitochalara longipes BDJ]|nr:acid protease [Stipitochalara longipes BDJ]
MILAERIEPRSTTPAPIPVTPSQDWDGNDGPWSSFAFQIGNPPQSVKLLISTALAQTWAVAPEGCGSGDPVNCTQLRGGEYNYNTSSTWVPNLADASTQIYYLTLESNLGYAGKGIYGFDDITLDFQGGGEVTLKNQTIAGIATEQYYMGLFGLAPRATNFSSDGAAVPSFMDNLRSQGKIPSISWGYTAGNQYRLSQVLGSLTLGGYDTSRFIPNDVSIPFAPDVDKDLTVQIDSISMDEGVSLLPFPIPAFLDSTVPYLYLPASACALFESAFGLVWNETAQLYLVNSTQHIHLQTQKPNVTFTIGSNSTASKVNITLPYAAFDLTASDPLVDGTARYFPLQRANNTSQYILGRTFFQEAYVIADFERKNFSVFQCNWVEAPQNIVAILPPANSTLGPISRPGAPSKDGVAKIAGVAISAALLVLGAFLLWLYWWRPRQQKRTAIKLGSDPPTPRETQEYYKPELECSPAGTMRFEVESGTKVDQIAEIDTKTLSLYEMPAREEVAVEMTAQTKPSEIGGREQRWSWVRGDSRASRFRFGGKGSGEKSEKSEESGDSEGTLVGPGEGEDTMSSLSSGMGSLADWLGSPGSFEQKMESLGDYIVSPQVASPQNFEQRMGNLEDYIVSPQIVSPQSPEQRMKDFGNKF